MDIKTLFSGDQDKFRNVLDMIDLVLKISITDSTILPESGRRLLKIISESISFGMPIIVAILSALQARFAIVHRQISLDSNGIMSYGRILHR